MRNQKTAFMKHLLLIGIFFTGLSAFGQTNNASEQSSTVSNKVVSGFGTFEPSVFIQPTVEASKIVSGFGTFDASVFIQNTSDASKVVSGFGTFDPSVFIQNSSNNNADCAEEKPKQ